MLTLILKATATVCCTINQKIDKKTPRSVRYCGVSEILIARGKKEVKTHEQWICPAYPGRYDLLVGVMVSGELHSLPLNI